MPADPARPETLEECVRDERCYRIVRLPSFQGVHSFDYAVLDPNGLVKHRSGMRGSLTQICEELQEAFELGLTLGARR